MNIDIRLIGYKPMRTRRVLVRRRHLADDLEGSSWSGDLALNPKRT
jgi:hypothetical protein